MKKEANRINTNRTYPLSAVLIGQLGFDFRKKINDPRLLSWV
ncbi:MAG TPA: hypothetical protein VGE28_13430 [Pseudomonas sp.]